jgi:hypothetical protein
MAHLITSDDDYRDLTYDDAHRSYLITRTDAPYGYRFGRTQGKRVRVHARTALGRVNGFLKNMIEAIADSKLLAMVKFLGPPWGGPVGKYRPEDHYMRGPGPKCRERNFINNASAGGT